MKRFLFAVALVLAPLAAWAADTRVQVNDATNVYGELPASQLVVTINGSQTTLGAALGASSCLPGSCAITGGSIDGTPIGATTPSSGKFTTLGATGTTTLGTGTGTVMTVTGGGRFGNSNSNTLTVGAGNGNQLLLGGTNAGLAVQPSGSGGMSVLGGNGGTIFAVNGSGSSVANNVTIIGGATGSAPTVAGAGSDTNIQLKLQGKGGWAASSAGAVLVNNSPLLVTPGTQTVSTDVVPGLNINYSVAGTATNNPALRYDDFHFTINSDTLALPGNNQFAIGMQLQHNYGGAAMTGNRNALEINLVQTATTGNALGGNNSGFYVSFESDSIASFNDNGTGLTVGTAHGRVFAGNFNAQCQTGATNFFQCTGLEVNTEIDTGASALIRNGISVAALSGSTQGTLVDAGIWLYQTSGANFQTGILFGGGGAGLNNNPIATGGTYIADDISNTHNTPAYGIHFVNSFSNNAIDVNGAINGTAYKVSGTAGVSCAAGTVNTATMVVTNGIVTHC